ncbi:MAG TPA: hypothetical protein V6C81_19545 [Planktothrix sp.]|jgi:hypothetical protein
MKNLRDLLNNKQTQTETSDGMRLVVEPSSEKESGVMTVNVGMPGNMQTVTLDRSQKYTVSDVLQRAEIKADNYEIRMGGSTVNLNTPVTKDHSTILLLHAIKGNR